MLQDAADVVQARFTHPGVAVAGKQGLIIFPQALVHVHTGAVVIEQRFGHEGHGLAVFARHVANDVLVPDQLVSHVHQGIETHIDFGLATGGHFVVLRFNPNADLLHHQHHLGADVVHAIGRRDREIALFVARLVAQVRTFFTAGVPLAFYRVDEVVTGILGGVVTDVVKNEKLGFRPKKRRVGNATCL